jgi:hypothetical protein
MRTNEDRRRWPWQLLPFLLLWMAQASVWAGGTTTAEGPSAESATVRAVRLKPMDSDVVDVTCRTFYAAGSQRFRCVVEYVLTAEQQRVDWLGRSVK